MAHSPELRMQLRSAYIGGLPLEHAADKVGVPHGTARNWYRAALGRGDDWDRFRAASLIVAGGGIEQALGRIIAAGLMRCEALLDKTEDAEDPFDGVRAMATLGDTIAKLRAAAKSFMPEVSALDIAVDTLKALAAHTTKIAPARGMALAELLEPFAESRKLPIAAALEELRAQARAAGAVDTAKAGGLSDDSAEQIRSKILGVK